MSAFLLNSCSLEICGNDRVRVRIPRDFRGNVLVKVRMESKIKGQLNDLFITLLNNAVQGGLEIAINLFFFFLQKYRITMFFFFALCSVVSPGQICDQ